MNRCLLPTRSSVGKVTGKSRSLIRPFEIATFADDNCKRLFTETEPEQQTQQERMNLPEQVTSR